MSQRRDVQEFANRLTREGLSASTVQNTLDPLRVIYRRAIRDEEVTADPTERLELRRPDGRRERIADPRRSGGAHRFHSRGRAGAVGVRVLRRPAARGAACAALGRRRPAGPLDPRLAGLGCDRARAGGQECCGQPARADPRAARAGSGRTPAPHRRLQRSAGVRQDCHRAVQPGTIRRNALAAWGWQEVPNKEADGPRTILAKKRDDAQQPITLHEARHTCASLLIAAGVNAKALSVIMGHATIAMTFDTYGHLMPGGLDEAAAAANAYLAGDGQRPALRLVG